MAFRTSLATALCLAASAGLVATAPAAAKELKLSYSHQADMASEIHTAAWVFKNYVNETVGDSLQVKLYPANALGEERAVYEGMQLGGGASCVISGTTILNNFSKKMGVVDLPFLWQSYDHMHHVFDGPVGKELAGDVEKIGLKAIGWLDSWGWRNVVTAKKEVKTPEDLKGLKIRTIQSPVYVGALNAMGANATPMAFGEVYTAMQTGVLDGFEHGSAVVVAQKYYEVSKYIALTEHLISPLIFACSGKEWQGWSDKEKQAVQAGAKLGQDVNRALAPQREAEAFEFLKTKGMTINKIDKTGFVKAAVDVQNKFAKDLGAEHLLKTIRETK